MAPQKTVLYAILFIFRFGVVYLDSSVDNPLQLDLVGTLLCRVRTSKPSLKNGYYVVTYHGPSIN